MAGLVGYASSDDEGEDEQPQLQQETPQVFKDARLAFAQQHFH
jgi:hypothetical protein